MLETFWRGRPPVGLRTLKTALAVILSLLVVQQYGASPAKVVFATIGAMSAVGPTFTASALACLTQICGVVVGVLLALALLALPIHPMAAVGVGIVLILAGYQQLRLKLVPVLPCLILANLCLTPDVDPLAYSLGRIWDTAIGLAIGMAVNTLIFPYDNSRSIRRTMEGLDRDLVAFLEDMFDGVTTCPRRTLWRRRSTPWRDSWSSLGSSACSGAGGSGGCSGSCPAARTSPRSCWWSWRPSGTWSGRAGWIWPTARPSGPWAPRCGRSPPRGRSGRRTWWSTTTWPGRWSCAGS